MFALLEIFVSVLFVIVGCSRHILRHIIVPLACHTGEHDHCCIGKIFRALHQFIRILRSRGFRQRPVLCGQGHLRPLCGKLIVEIDQILIYAKPRICQAVDQADSLIQIIESAGSGPAVCRID